MSIDKVDRIDISSYIIAICEIIPDRTAEEIEEIVLANLAKYTTNPGQAYVNISQQLLNEQPKAKKIAVNQ